jgi:hypothetical protein
LVKALYESTPALDNSTLESLSVNAIKTDIEPLKEPLKILTAHASGCLLGPMRDEFKSILKDRFLDPIAKSQSPSFDTFDQITALTNGLNLSCRSDDPSLANVDYWTLVFKNGCVKKGDIEIGFKYTDLDGREVSDGFFTIGPDKTFVAGRTRSRAVFYHANTKHAKLPVEWWGTDPNQKIVLHGKTYLARSLTIVNDKFGRFEWRLHCDNTK